MKTITTPDFMGRIAKIVEEVSARACVDKTDTEVMEEILQASLKESYTMVDEYCTMVDEEYYIALTRAQNRAYDEGHADGYALGYDDGYSLGHDDGYLDGHSAV